jgi:hypothetical protein
VRIHRRLEPRLLDIEQLDQVGEHCFRGRDPLGPVPEYFTFDLELEGRMQRFEWNGLPFYRSIDG